MVKDVYSIIAEQVSKPQGVERYKGLSEEENIKFDMLLRKKFSHVTEEDWVDIQRLHLKAINGLMSGVGSANE